LNELAGSVSRGTLASLERVGVEGSGDRDGVRGFWTEGVSEGVTKEMLVLLSFAGIALLFFFGAGVVLDLYLNRAQIQDVTSLTKLLDTWLVL
jgi:hypothetical protein